MLIRLMLVLSLLVVASPAVAGLHRSLYDRNERNANCPGCKKYERSNQYEENPRVYRYDRAPESWDDADHCSDGYCER